MIIKCILKIIKWIKEHIFGVLLGSAGAGAAAAGVGIHNARKAKRINKNAVAIQEAALEKHDNAYRETQAILEELGESEKTAIDSFPFFADTMARIQGRPQIKTNVLSSVNLPNYEPEEIKSLSANLQMAIVGAGGAGAGALAGLAAFGAGAIIAAPAMLGTGLVLCVKGIGLRKKAVENERQAKSMAKSVDEIIAFYGELQSAARQYKDSVCAVYERYVDYLNRVEGILSEKTTWKEFSKIEKRTVENTVLLARLLYEMTKTNIIIKQDSEEKLEKLNSAEMVKLQKQAGKLLQEAV